MSSHTSSMSNGRSGIRITSAPPASPEWSAIQPAWRPITSTTITRLCDSAVVCSRSIASVAICTAVWKPNVKSVPARSLSIVFGTPTTFTPSSPSRRATPRVSPPPVRTPIRAMARHSTQQSRRDPIPTAPHSPQTGGPCPARLRARGLGELPLVRDLGQPVEALGQVPVLLAQELHRRREEDGPDQRGVEQDRDGQADAHLLELDRAEAGEDGEHGHHHHRG